MTPHRPAIGIAAIALAAVAVIAVAIAGFWIVLGPDGMNPGGPGIAEASSSSTATVQASTNPNNTISVSGLGVCASNCNYPSPYASALVTINASVPLSTLKVYVNNTYDGLAIQNPSTTTIACTTAAGQTCSVQLGGTGYSNATYTTTTKYYATCPVPVGGTSCSATYTASANTMTKYAYLYKGSVPGKFVPAVPGAVYVFTFVAAFQDGSTATATASTVAS